MIIFTYYGQVNQGKALIGGTKEKRKDNNIYNMWDNKGNNLNLIRNNLDKRLRYKRV